MQAKNLFLTDYNTGRTRVFTQKSFLSACVHEVNALSIKVKSTF